MHGLAKTKGLHLFIDKQVAGFRMYRKPGAVGPGNFRNH